MPFDERRADSAIWFIEGLKLTGDFHGKPLVLMPWQSQIIHDVYGTLNERGTRQYRYAYLECAKKNAKSQITSAIAILHLFSKAEPNGQIIICAGDKEQAESTIYNPIVEMLEQDPELMSKVKITDSRKIIEQVDTHTRLRVISAEAFTKHGWNISCCIFDELHVQPNRNLYDTMMHGAGLGRRQPIWWFLTTAGDDPDRVTIAWEVHEKAKSILKARAKGDAEHDIATWYPVIYSYEGDDIYNEANWPLANPSLGTTLQIEDLRDLAAEAKLSPADERLFRWLNLSQWVTTKLTTWLTLELFDKTVGTWDRKDLIGKECYVGMDLSSTTDLTAIALLFPPQGEQQDWRVIWESWIPEEGMKDRINNDKVPYDQWAAGAYITPTPGDVVDYTRVRDTILELSKLYKILEIPADTSFAAMLLQELEQQKPKYVVPQVWELQQYKDGVKPWAIDVPQTFDSLTDPMNQIETLLKSGRMTHEANPVARWCFGNTSIAKNGNSQIKYVKEHKGRGVDRTKRIDLTAALVIAMARARFYKGVVDLSAKVLDPEWGM